MDYPPVVFIKLEILGHIRDSHEEEGDEKLLQNHAPKNFLDWFIVTVRSQGNVLHAHCRCSLSAHNKHEHPCRVFCPDCGREATELGGSTGTASDLLAATTSGVPNNNKQTWGQEW